NGQFYVDGPFLFAAIGWWTVFCLALAFRETFLLLATRRAAEQSERRDNLPLCLLSCLLWIWAALHGWPPIFFSCISPGSWYVPVAAASPAVAESSDIFGPEIGVINFGMPNKKPYAATPAIPFKRTRAANRITEPNAG